MAVVIAPWLETKPSDFLNAAKSGAEVGAQLHGQNLEHSARMAAIAQQASEAGLRAQEASERTAVAREIAKNRMALQTQQAANLFQQQRQRQTAIDGGMDPIQAWLQFPGTTSGSPGAGVFGAYENQRRASLPLEPVPDPNNPGRVAGFHDGNRFFPLPMPKATAAAKVDPLDMVAIRHLQATLKTAETKLPTLPPGDPDRRATVMSILNSREGLKKYGVNLEGPQAAPTSRTGGPAQRGLPQKGEVINGHTFLGGDPADKNSWQEVNPEGSSFIGTPGQPNEAALPGDMQDNQPVPDETEEQ